MDLNTNNIVMHNNNNKSCEQGRWTREEHELFLQGMAIFGKNWKQVQQLINHKWNILNLHALLLNFSTPTVLRANTVPLLRPQ